MADARLQVLLDFKSKLAGLDKANRGIRKTIGNVGALAVGVAGVAGAAATIRSSIQAIAGFDTAMLKVKSLTSATGEEFTALKANARELGATTQYSASQAADGMGFLAMAGFQANEIIGAMPSVLTLAAAANMELADSADITSNILTGYRMEVDQLSYANDVLVKTFTSSNTNLSQLGEAMKTTGPVAARLKVPFAETAAAIGLMGNAGIQGEMAGTSLRNIMLRLVDPSAEAQSSLKQLGIQAFDAQGNFVGLVDLLEQFEKAQPTDQQLSTIFGARAFAPFAALISQGSTALKEFTQEVDNAGGTAQRVADVQMSGLEGAWKRLKSVAESVALSFGDQGATGVMTRLVNTTTEVLKVIDDIVQSDQKIKMVSLALQAGFEEGFIAIKEMMKNFFSGDGAWKIILASVMELSVDVASTLLEGMVSPIAFVAAAWHKVWQEISAFIVGYIEWVVNKWIDSINWLVSQVNKVLPKSKEIDLFNNVEIGGDGPQKFGDIMKENKETLQEMTSLMIDGLVGNLEKSLEVLQEGTEEYDAQLRALERLNALREEDRQRRKKETPTLPDGGNSSNAPAIPTGAVSAPTEGAGGGGFLGNAGSGFISGVKKYIDEIPTVEKRFATMAESIAGTFDNVIGGSIMGVIQGTQTWGDVINNIGNNILGTVISSIVKMGVTWTTTQLATFLFGQKLKAADSATTAAKGATDAAAMAPAAATASIASFGAAAAIGLAAVLGAMAIFGGFAEGGYTGYGSKYQPAGIVHKGEFVFPQDVTERLGAANLYQMMADTRMGYSGGGYVGSQNSPGPNQGGGISILNVDGPDAYADAVEQMQGQIIMINRQLGIS